MSETVEQAPEEPAETPPETPPPAVDPPHQTATPAPAPATDEPGGDEPEPAPDLRRIVSSRVAARNALLNSNISVGTGDVYIGGNDQAREPFVAPDRTEEAKNAAAQFVAPTRFAELRDAVGQRRVTALLGPTCGKRTAALVALQRTDHTPIIELPAGLPPSTLADVVKQITAERGPVVGVLIDGVDRADLADLAGFRARQLREALPRGAALVMTAVDGPAACEDLAIVHAEAPDPVQVLAIGLKRGKASAEASEVAHAAVAALTPPVTPGVVLGVAEAASARTHTVESLVAMFETRATDEALEAWLGTGREGRDVAALAAAATLEGAPLADVDEAAAALALRLEPDAPAESEAPKRFGAATRGWPSGIVDTRRSAFGTHFGAQETEVVTFCTPHSRERVLLFLWQRLGWDFRRPFLEWLYELGGHRANPVRDGAGITAGLLFSEDPIFIERDVLSRWASSDNGAMEKATATALGVPNAYDRDRTPARALVRNWAGTTNNLRFVRVAVRAYGGLLGAWDPGALAPSRLWSIGEKVPQLTLATDFELGFLVSAGGEAALTRAAVLNLLSEESNRRTSAGRAYRVLAIALRRLTSRDAQARQSLVALGEHESASFTVLATLLSQALTAGVSQSWTRYGFESLISAVADGRVERDLVVRLIRELRTVTVPNRRPALAARLERALNKTARSDEPDADVAKSLLDQFFGS